MSSSTDRVRDVMAAGVVVFGRGATVLLVHRPKYDDWSFPKGKLDAGERAPVAAVREVGEETGLTVRLGPPLGSQRYPVRDGMKSVHYWSGRVVGDPDVSGYQPNDEIDDVAWVDVEKAPDVLTYERDVETLHDALDRPLKTRTVAVLRHAVARSKGSWSRDDRRRPLVAAGRRQADRLVPVLAAYDVRRLVTSSSDRCVQTLEPFARAAGHELDQRDELSEEDATKAGVKRLMASLLEELLEARRRSGGLVVCTHRPVLPWVFEAIGAEDPGLAKGELCLLHLRGSRIVAAERHQAG